MSRLALSNCSDAENHFPPMCPVRARVMDVFVIVPSCGGNHSVTNTRTKQDNGRPILRRRLNRLPSMIV